MLFKLSVFMLSKMSPNSYKDKHRIFFIYLFMVIAITTAELLKAPNMQSSHTKSPQLRSLDG